MSKSVFDAKAKKGFQGYPIATVAFYGPDLSRATKVAVGIILADNTEPSRLERWLVETGDIRSSKAVGKQVVEWIRSQEVRTVAMTGGIIGCPHEEGTDYAVGEACPHCPFWAVRNRFTGQFEH